MSDEQQYVSGMLERTGLYFSASDLEKVRNATFAIAGLGGVGAITAELTARWGVRRFRLFDMDRYEPSNLNRQLFATSRTLGRTKPEAAAERIKEINPYAEIEAIFCERVNNENVDPFVNGADIVLQNADHPSCKLFYSAARRHKVPLVNGYAGLSGGRVQTFDYRKSECRSVLDSLWQKIKFGDMKPLEEMSPEEIARFDRENVHPTAPSLNFVTNMVGCLIVAEAVKLLTGKGKLAHYPRYVEFDSFTHRMKVKNSLSPFNCDTIRVALKAVSGRMKRG